MEIIIAPCRSRSYKTWSLFSPLCCSSPLSLSWNSSLTCPILRVFQHSKRVSIIRMGKTCPWEYPLTKPTISPTLSTLQAACAPLPSLQPPHPPSSPPMANCVLCSALLVFPPKSTLAVVLVFLTPIILSLLVPRAQNGHQAPRRE